MVKGSVIPVLLGLSCGPAEPPGERGSDPSSAEAAEAPSQPTDDGPAVLGVPEPTWSAAELTELLTEAFAGGLPEPFGPRDLYVAMFEHADGDCPTSPLPYHLPGDYEGCTTADGTYFFGHGEYQEGVQADALDSFYLLGDFYILDPEGQRFDGAGEVLYSVEEAEGEADALFALFLSGTWGYGGSAGWMAEPTSVSLTVYGVQAGDRALGSLEGSADLAGRHLFFEDLSFDPGLCEDAPIRGSLQVRDPSGYWYDLDFSEACTGCAPLTWVDGSSLGEVCPDFGDAPAALLGRLATADGRLEETSP